MTAHPQAFGNGMLSAWRVDASLGPASRPPIVRAGLPELDPVLVRDSSDTALLAFGDIATFRIDFDAREVNLVSVHSDADAATIDHFLNDHVAPRVIAHLGALVIHGSAVAIGGQLAIFMGTTGAGKSTLAASLLKRGHQLLGDDAVVIGKTGSGWVGEAVYPSLRLFPASISEVFPESVDSDAMAFYSDKRLVRADALLDQEPVAVPLGRIFLLADGEVGVSDAQLGFADACMMIVENSFTLDPDDPVAAADRMAKAAALAAAVPCHTLSYPYDFAILDDVCRHVAALMEGREQPAPNAGAVQ